jgi:hypothetical protein
MYLYTVSLLACLHGLDAEKWELIIPQGLLIRKERIAK